jgi:CheY-like chemotaxis protein
MLIEKTGCADHFHTFNSGHNAFKFLDTCIAQQTSFPKYILLDLNMPDMDGIDFIEKYEAQYASQHKDTEVIVLTSSVREQDNETALSYASVSHFISKPISKEDLVAFIQKSMES